MAGRGRQNFQFTQDMDYKGFRTIVSSYPVVGFLSIFWGLPIPCFTHAQIRFWLMDAGVWWESVHRTLPWSPASGCSLLAGTSEREWCLGDRLEIPSHRFYMGPDVRDMIPLKRKWSKPGPARTSASRLIDHYMSQRPLPNNSNSRQPISLGLPRQVSHFFVQVRFYALERIMILFAIVSSFKGIMSAI